MREFQSEKNAEQTSDKMSEPKEASIEVGIRPRFQHKNSRLLRLLGLAMLCFCTSLLTIGLVYSWGLKARFESLVSAPRSQDLIVQENDVTSAVFKQANPSVVTITSQSITASRYFGSTVEEGQGSGIIISKDGYIVTNKHVVPDGVGDLRVILADGREFKDITLIGRDPSNDLAFLKVQGVTDLPVARLGDSSAVQPGQRVVAIGNALGEFRSSITAGIISGIGRPLTAGDGVGTAEHLENLFQTDAAINPGNSGGPLLDMKGQVIGINTAVAQQAQGIGFAIPINDAKGLIATVLAKGKIIKPYLGLRYVMLNPDLAAKISATSSYGAYVSGNSSDLAVLPGGPADKAGIRAKDIILKINGKQLSDTRSLSSVLAQFSPGDKVSLEILRDNKQQTIMVTLEAYPNL